MEFRPHQFLQLFGYNVVKFLITLNKGMVTIHNHKISRNFNLTLHNNSLLDYHFDSNLILFFQLFTLWKQGMETSEEFQIILKK